MLTNDTHHTIRFMAEVLCLVRANVPCSAVCIISGWCCVQNEVKLLLELLPKYYAHVERYPHTLLIKFYGLHRVVPLNGSKVRQ